MIFHKTLISIRKKHNLTQLEFARALGCPVEKIAVYESNDESVPITLVPVIRRKFNLIGAPILETERAALMEELYGWKTAIDYADINKAAELQPILEKAAKTSFSTSTKLFYNLFLADYYLMMGTVTPYETQMAYLARKGDAMGAKHRYYYYRLIGAREFVAKRFQEAINAYKKAEMLDKYSEWHDVRFYFGMGMSLSDRGFAKKAIRYLEKAKNLARHSKIYNGMPNSRFDVYIDGYLAYNYSKLGKIEEALKILGKRLEIEMRNYSKAGIGYTYFTFGRVYYCDGNYAKAIENYETALMYLDEKHSAYMSTLYQMASALNDINKTDEAIKVAEKGLEITSDEYRKTLFDALKHSASLHNNHKAAIHLRDTLIPKLQKHGDYDAAAYYYQKLSDFYYEDGNSDIALRYSNLANETHKQFLKELREGDM